MIGKEIAASVLCEHRRAEALKRTERIHALERALEMAIPSEGDLDWMELAIQRHTGGMEAWWAQNRENLSFRDFARVTISTWEAGRSKAAKVEAALCGQ